MDTAENIGLEWAQVQSKNNSAPGLVAKLTLCNSLLRCHTHSTDRPGLVVRVERDTCRRDREECGIDIYIQCL